MRESRSAPPAACRCKPDEAASILIAVEDELRELGRHYDAACVALDIADALAARGDASGAEAARSRAAALLEPIGCVNAF